MTPEDTQTENAEAERAANLFCAGIKDCFFYALDHPEDIHPELCFQEIQFRVLDGSGAALLQQHTGLLTVLVDAPAPLRAWFPERLSVSIKPEYAPIWKNQILSALSETRQDLRDAWAEAIEQDASKAAEGGASDAPASEVEVEVLPPEGVVPEPAPVEAG